MASIETCPDRQMLQDYLLGKLPVSQQQSTESHVAECQPCVETLLNLKTDCRIAEEAGHEVARIRETAERREPLHRQRRSTPHQRARWLLANAQAGRPG